MATRQGTLTRAVAIDALTHVLTRRIHADTALQRLFNHHTELRPLDRAFIFELVYGSLRWLSKMDWIMGHMMDRPFVSLDPRVANALRIGAYQIYYMDKVPDRAAVSETVEAIKSVGAGNASSFVNAILRRVAKKAEYFPKPDKNETPVEYYAMHYAHPAWMVDRWLRSMSTERLEHVCMGNNTPPKHTLRALARNPLPNGEDLGTYLLREHGIASGWRPLPRSIRSERLPPFESCRAFQEGGYVVQDEAAQLVSTVVAPSPTDTVLDCCAAPGTKSIVMWDEGLDPKRLTVCDSSMKRVQLLEQNFARVGLTDVEILRTDAVDVMKERRFSKIVIDAPCSGLGVIRRHPEIKWLRTPDQIEKNAREQARLLDAAAKSVTDDGEIFYIVCSAEIEESHGQIARFIERHPDFRIVNLRERVHAYYRRYLTTRGEVLFVPGNVDDTDGFFAAALTRSRRT